jgi:hypothetical protein
VDARLCLTRGFLLLITGLLFLLALFDSQDHSPLRAWLETTGMVGGFYFGLREFGRGLVAELGWPR